MKQFLRILKITTLVTLCLWGCTGKQSQPDTSNVQQPQSIPQSMYEDLEGNPIDLGSFKGKRVFLNFWATWCKPCVKEMPDIEKAFETLQNENYIFLLASDEESKKIKEFANRTGHKLNFIRFNGSYEAHNIYSLPTTFVFDTSGKKVKQMTGAYAWHKEKVLNNLRSVK